MGETQNIPNGPTEQHEQLMKKVGSWKVACQYFLGGETVTADGTDRQESLGAFWTVGHFRCEMMGTEILGLATTGFDPVTGKYTGTWQDSATPYRYSFAGGFDDEGALVMEGENYDPFTRSMATYRSVETIGAEERSLALFIVPAEGDPVQVLEYQYTRA